MGYRQALGWSQLASRIAKHTFKTRHLILFPELYTLFVVALSPGPEGGAGRPPRAPDSKGPQSRWIIHWYVYTTAMNTR